MSESKPTRKEKKAAKRAAKAARHMKHDPHEKVFPKPTKRQSIVMIVIVVALALLSYYVRLAPGSTDDGTVSDAATTEQTVPVDTTADDVADAAEEAADADQTVVYQAGTYTAGTDIAAGNYKFLATGSDGAIIECDGMTMAFTKSYWLTLEEGESMTVTGATFVSADRISPVNAETLEAGGLYRVGVDCPAGVYVATQQGATEGASVVAYSGDGVDKVEISDTAVEAGTNVTFNPDTYVWLGGCDAVYTKE